MRTIGVVTTSRADWGIYRPLLKAIQSHEDLALHLIVSGMHLSPEHGSTVRQIEEEGFPIGDRVESLLSSDTAEGVSASMGLAVMGYARSLAKQRPDILVVLGDRFEMFAAACAAAPFRLPIAHIHGGELTLGALDDMFRHAMTKLSHLHLVTTEEYGKRAIQMGEEPWRVTVCGALSLDNMADIPLMDKAELESELDLDLTQPPLLVTYHPETLSEVSPADQVKEVLAALDQLRHPVVFTMPNADAGGREIAELIKAFSSERPWASIRDNLGSQRYFSLMKQSAAMVGNSSSGIIEAASFGLPVVNIGGRQKGRVKAANIIKVDLDREKITHGIMQALEPGFAEPLANLPNPYFKGGAARLAVDVLAKTELGQGLLLKGFNDFSPESLEP